MKRLLSSIETEIVVMASAGYDSIDFKLVKRKTWSSANVVAELLFGMMLMSARKTMGSSGFELVYCSLAVFRFRCGCTPVHNTRASVDALIIRSDIVDEDVIEQHRN